MNLKIRLEISFILKHKTREDVKLQDHLVQTKQELKSTRKLLNQAMEIIKKQSEQSQSEQSKPKEEPANKKRKRKNGSAKYKTSLYTIWLISCV